MQFDKKAALLAVCVGGLVMVAGCSEKQYAQSGSTPAASTKAAVAPTPKDPMAKPGSDEPGSR